MSVDLVICTGDFQVICNQAIRDEADLETLTCPRKYLKMGDFHKYYSGEKALACLLAQAVGWLVAARIAGTPPSLAAAGLQWLATVLLFPIAAALIERFRDADVRFR